MEIQKSKYITPKTNFSETHLRKFYPHPKKNRTIFRKFPKLNELCLSYVKIVLSIPKNHIIGKILNVIALRGKKLLT